MTIELEDVIGILNELLEHRQQVALRPHESVHTQYVNLGAAEGVKIAIKKLQELNRREAY